VFIVADLERLLEPISQLLLPTSRVKHYAADAMTRARQAGVDPAWHSDYVQVLLDRAARAQFVSTASGPGGPPSSG
jgi:hypothetical protein